MTLKSPAVAVLRAVHIVKSRLDDARNGIWLFYPRIGNEINRVEVPDEFPELESLKAGNLLTER